MTFFVVKSFPCRGKRSSFAQSHRLKGLFLRASIAQELHIIVESTLKVLRVKVLLVLMCSVGVLWADSSILKENKAYAEKGSLAHQIWLGMSYRYGQDAPRNDMEALKWYKMAAEQGHPESQFQVGHLYHKGREPLKKDLVASYAWFSVATKSNKKIQSNVNAVAKAMTPEQVEEGKKFAEEILNKLEEK